MDSVRWRSRTFAAAAPAAACGAACSAGAADGLAGAGAGSGASAALAAANSGHSGRAKSVDPGLAGAGAAAELRGRRDRPRELRQAARGRALQMAEEGMCAAARLKAAGLQIGDRADQQLHGLKARIEQEELQERAAEESRDAAAMIWTEGEEKGELVDDSEQGAADERGGAVPVGEKDDAERQREERRLRFFQKGMDRRFKAVQAKQSSGSSSGSSSSELCTTAADTRKAREAAREEALALREIALREKNSVRTCRVAMKEADDESRRCNVEHRRACARREAFASASAELLWRMQETGFLPNQSYGRLKLFALQGLRKKAGRLKTEADEDTVSDYESDYE